MDISESRTVVVTGVTGGVGRATCLKLAQDGYNIIGQYRSQDDTAQALAREVESTGRLVLMVRADLVSPNEQLRFIDRVGAMLDRGSLGELAGLVNNAAKLVGPSFESATPEAYDEYFALNTKAPFFLSQGLSAYMSSGASIVNISSVATRFSSSGDIVYAMTKAALEAFTFHASEYLAQRGIRINTVMPGFTDNGHPAFSNPTAHAYMASFSALGGVADPGTVAAAVAFLLSDSSRRTTGSVLDVSGGSALGRRPMTGSLEGFLG